MSKDDLIAMATSNPELFSWVLGLVCGLMIGFMVASMAAKNRSNSGDTTKARFNQQTLWQADSQKAAR